MAPELLARASVWLKGRTPFAVVTDVVLDRSPVETFGEGGLEMEVHFTRGDNSPGWYPCSEAEAVDLWRALMSEVPE